MIKKDFIEKIAEETGLNGVMVKTVVDQFITNIQQALLSEQRIELRNFGVFNVKKRKPKIGRNPKTGEEVLVPERLKVVFKPSKIFKFKRLAQE